MRHLIVASHAHFSKGIMESLELVSGEIPGARVITAFVDGFDDISSLVDSALAEVPLEDEVVVCTDVFGGSVNNEFNARLASRPGMHLITNMNLPLLLQLAFIGDSDLATAIRGIVLSDNVVPKYVNDLVVEDVEEDDF